NWIKGNWDKTNTITFDYSENLISYNGGDIQVLSTSFKGCKRVEINNLTDEEYISTNGSNRIFININKSKLSTVDVNGLNEYFVKNNLLVKYQLATPQKIVLPLDVQIQLNSFFGTTHVYMESGEVEGT